MNTIIATQRAGAEAIGDGIPAIVSRKIEIAEIIEHHGGGQIIKPATDQIISAIEEYLEQQDHPNTLSQQAIRFAEQALSFKKTWRGGRHGLSETARENWKTLETMAASR